MPELDQSPLHAGEDARKQRETQQNRAVKHRHSYQRRRLIRGFQADKDTPSVLCHYSVFSAS